MSCNISNFIFKPLGYALCECLEPVYGYAKDSGYASKVSEITAIAQDILVNFYNTNTTFTGISSLIPAVGLTTLGYCGIKKAIQIWTTTAKKVTPPPKDQYHTPANKPELKRITRSASKISTRDNFPGPKRKRFKTRRS
ncbi:MAG: hypothetical protein WCT85_04800 [Parachlamydiales bacterium]|jgi:hypothetical protein